MELILVLGDEDMTTDSVLLALYGELLDDHKEDDGTALELKLDGIPLELELDVDTAAELQLEEVNVLDSTVGSPEELVGYNDDAELRL